MPWLQWHCHWIQGMDEQLLLKNDGCNYVSQWTHWGRETHICVGKLTIIASDNGLSPGQRQAIIWTNAGILLIGPLGTNFNEISIEIHTLSFKEMHMKMASAKWHPFCFGPNVLNHFNKRGPWNGSMLKNSISHSIAHSFCCVMSCFVCRVALLPLWYSQCQWIKILQETGKKQLELAASRIM